MQVYKSKFADAFFEKEMFLFSVVWKDPKQKMTDEFFKQTIKEYIPKIVEFKPNFFLFDASTIFFPVDPMLQEWMNENSLSKTRDIIQKEAVLVKKDLIMYLSAEQTLETEKIRKTERKIFHNKTEALEWLFSE